ncbi:MAG: alkaline phosphatase D family protein [Enterobacterales bacterium]|nr:alkaline phosphatase D family protein [Enterobacterales bacterium]
MCFNLDGLDYKKKRIHIIILDTRWYRDQLVYSYLTKDQRKTLNLGPYQPVFDQNATILGEQQWQWLDQQLSQKADLIILVSSIQVLNQYSGWEIWANFPKQRTKLLDLIADKTDNNLIILSGDVHRAEISEITYKNTRILEMTSSGLAVRTYPASINNHRVGEAINDLNYGMINIQSLDNKIDLTAAIYDSEGKQRLSAKMEIK